jgi:hypothetical protein
VDDIAPFDAGFFDATLPSKDASPFSDGSSADVWVDTGVFNGGGPFVCLNCICDGTLDMCFAGHDAGVALDGSFADASTCDPDAGQAYCSQIPIACLPKPTCACIAPLVAPCSCSVDATGNGFVITCNIEPPPGP